MCRKIFLHILLSTVTGVNGFALVCRTTIIKLSYIRNWIRNIEQHASDNVNKILVGNKADMDESKRVVPTSKGQARADEYGIKFFETSAKTNLNVEQVFFSIARDVKQRLTDTDSRAEPQTIKINQPEQGAAGGQLVQKSACCVCITAGFGFVYNQCFERVFRKNLPCRTSQEPSVLKLKEPALDEITHALVGRSILIEYLIKRVLCSLHLRYLALVVLLEWTDDLELFILKGYGNALNYQMGVPLLEDIVQSMEQAIMAKEGYINYNNSY
ncbi:hypothetical protein CsSME_00001326 [Camellia sinensis var. sinensis]